MKGNNSLGEVFRFAQLRPPKPADEVEAIRLLPTAVARSLWRAESQLQRIELANAALQDDSLTIRDRLSLNHGEPFWMALTVTREQAGPTTADLLDRIGPAGPIVESEQFRMDRIRLSDTLLAVTYGTFGTDRNLPELEDLYHVYALVVDAANGEAASGPLAGYLSRHLLTPKLFGDANYPSAERAEKVSAHNAPAIDVRAEPAGLPTRPPQSSAIE
jgi:hypothetical protein